MTKPQLWALAILEEYGSWVCWHQLAANNVSGASVRVLVNEGKVEERESVISGVPFREWRIAPQ